MSIKDGDLINTANSLMSVLHHVEISNVRTDFTTTEYNVANRMLFDDDHKYIHSDYSTYLYNANEWVPNYTSKYIREHYKVKACLYTLVIDAYNEKFKINNKYSS